jgi:hypothetical protein
MMNHTAAAAAAAAYLRLDAARDELLAQVVKAHLFVHLARGLLALGSVRVEQEIRVKQTEDLSV